MPSQPKLRPTDMLILTPEQVLGNDLSANMPTFVPPNVKFEVDDVESEWLHDEKFSWIFCRYMAAGIHDWPKLVNNIYEFVVIFTPGLLAVADLLPATSSLAAGASSRTSTCSTIRKTAP